MRWDFSGDTLATASNDNTAKVVDFTTGKILYKGTSSERFKYLRISGVPSLFNH